MKPSLAAYADRNAILREMGFQSYKDYLESQLWKSIRERVLARDKRACCACGGDAWQVHHTVYTRAAMEGRDITSLESICGGCHEWAEFTKKGTKRSLAQANRRMMHRCVECGKMFRIRCKLKNAERLVSERLKSMKCPTCKKEGRARHIESKTAAAPESGSLLKYLKASK